MRGIFITGCATGFGASLARRFLALGWRVVATDRSLDSLTPLLNEPNTEHLTLLELDVRDPQACRATVQRALADGPVDVLVNNAGFAVFGTIEESDLDAVQEMFDVNVFGLARVTQAWLPHLRSIGGTVVNLSSVAGRMAFPESGYYAASKHAVEAISESLYAEAASFGVRVVLIEPGSFDTQFLATATERSLPRDPDSPYRALQPRWDQAKQDVLEPPQNPRLVVAAIESALESDLRFQRVPVGPDCTRILNVVDRHGRSAYARLSAAQASGAPHWEETGDIEDADAALLSLLRPTSPE